MQVKFKLNNAQTKFGQNLGIVGNKKCLGNWSVSQINFIKTRYFKGKTSCLNGNQKINLPQVGVQKFGNLWKQRWVQCSWIQVHKSWWQRGWHGLGTGWQSKSWLISFLRSILRIAKSSDRWRWWMGLKAKKSKSVSVRQWLIGSIFFIWSLRRNKNGHKCELKFWLLKISSEHE